MENKKISWKTIILIVGSYMSFYIGSGFATGQENLQSYACYGLSGILSLLISVVILIIVMHACMKIGAETKLTSQSEIFAYFGGKWIGKFFDWYTFIFVFLLFGILISGGGATINTLTGLPTWAGNLILSLLSIACVVLGLNRMVDIIGALGPVLTVIILIVCVMGLVNADEGIIAGNAAVQQLDILKAYPNWFISGIMTVAAYTCTGLACLPAFARTMKGCGSRDIRIVTVLGPVCFELAVALTSLCMLENISEVYDAQIPLLVIASRISSVLGVLVGVMICVALFTTVTPLLYSCTAKFAQDGTMKFRVLAIVIGIAGAYGGSLLPFGTLINIIFPLSGYISFIMLVAVIICVIRKKGFTSPEAE